MVTAFDYGFRVLYTASLLFGWGALYEAPTVAILLLTLLVGFVIAAVMGGGGAPYQHAAEILLASGTGVLHLWMGRQLVAWSLVVSPVRSSSAASAAAANESDAGGRHRLPADVTIGSVLLTIVAVVMLVTIKPEINSTTRVLPVVVPAIATTVVVLLWRAGYKDACSARCLAARLIGEVVVVTALLRIMHEMAPTAGLLFTLLFATVLSAVLTVLVHRIPQ